MEKKPKHLGVFKLFVAGATPLSHLAVLRVQEICDAKIKRGYSLKVVDIYQQPKLAKANQVVATPTLIKTSPRSIRRYIGMKGIILGLSAELELLSVPAKKTKLTPPK